MKRDLQEVRTLKGLLGRYHELLKRNLKFVIPASILIVVSVFGILFYLYLEDKKSEELNYLLSEGIKVFREGLRKGDETLLTKSQEIFERIAKEEREGISDLSMVYIARIKQIKGEKEEAKRILESLKEKSDNEVVKNLVSSILEGKN